MVNVSFNLDDHFDDLKFEVDGPTDENIDNKYSTTAIVLTSGPDRLRLRDRISFQGMNNERFFKLADAVEVERQRRLQIIADERSESAKGPSPEMIALLDSDDEIIVTGSRNG